MPKWGIEMTEGTITSWRAAEGQRVEKGAEILDVETEKIVNAVEAPAGGTLRRILAGDGEVKAVGALIGVIADGQASDADIARFIESFVAAKVSFDPESAAVPVQPAPSAQPAAPVQARAEGDGLDEETRVSPIARRVAERLGVDLSKVTGTGRNGRISKEDVEQYAAQSGATAESAAATAPPTAAIAPPAGAAGSRADSERIAPGTIHRVRMSARRATIARRLAEAKQSIPHFRLDMDVDFGALLQHKRAQAPGGRVTVNDLLLRGVALALVQHPMVNAQLVGEEILQFEDADIAIAVATEAGLITPILRSANRKPLPAIAAESRDLIDRARRGALLREEIAGGSFTISNLGMHGVTRFDAIINAPQVAILAVGAVTSRPVIRAGALAAADVATLTLSADHRVVDGAVSAAFLSTLRDLLEKPAAL
jgi:pyruvate dehydrogenase E2 component (dihydrolipoamide acetyltransferase)